MVPSPEPPRPRLRAWLLAAGLSLCACEVASAAPAPERAAKRAEREAKRAERAAKRAEREPKAPAPPPAPKAPAPAREPKAPAPALQPSAACPPGNPLTSRSFGVGFLRTWCTGCHSSTLPEGQRQDAPAEVNFDTHAAFLPHAKEVLARATDPDSPMPPAGLVPEEERRRLAQWIACGAPQPPAP